MLQRQSPSSIKTQHLCRWVEYMEFLLLTETRTGAPRLLQDYYKFSKLPFCLMKFYLCNKSHIKVFYLYK